MEHILHPCIFHLSLKQTATSWMVDFPEQSLIYFYKIFTFALTFFKPTTMDEWLEKNE